MHSSTIFNSLLVALCASMEAAALPPAIEGVLPVVLPHRSGVKIGPKGPPHPRSLDITSLHPRSQFNSPTTLSSSAGSGTPKTRRMVYGWGPKSFESDNDGGSPFDMNLLSVNSAETAEHPPKDKQKVLATNKTEAAPTNQPPDDVLKTLCAYFLDGHSSKNRTTGSTYPPTRNIPPNQGSDKDPWLTSPGLSNKNNTGVTGSSSNSNGSSEKSSKFTGAGDKSVLAISWCYRWWSYNSPRLNSTDTDKKPSATESGTTSSSPHHDSKKGAVTPPDASLDKADPPVKDSTKHTNDFKKYTGGLRL
ncbi:hypothetical protein PCASD_14257 [Puccinia coronata f. sp. avenae]|uniref:Uncharacterized protein n=1 Tax=Puccinia coronata f. sp. avenae TaxID=200324 RepID=A0A2N5UB31_9BASI|nr:hypothetical protein PCASD_14257 [Puccinia coronata f. sp. avenae]